jgi:hypothetical protein
MEQTAMGGLRSNHRAYQHCFIGHSQGASWRETFEQVCEEVLPSFGLKPWYANKHFQGNIPLLQKVVNMIATTRYGIYDLSYWHENNQSAWIMPRNVLIELGMAIALNRPMLLLRHGENRECGLTLPACLEGIEIGEFGDGKKLLKQTLNTRLPPLTQHTPQQDWLNRYCHFGGLQCPYREAHPQAQQWGRQKIHIHISDGANAAHIDCSDFHDMIEDDVINRFNNLEFNYLNSLSSPQGCKFLLCSRCQEVRSSPFAIYRITPHTSADTFIAIGMSIALEKQFGYAIPKILITNDANTVPSLLKGYEIIVERNYTRIKDRLNTILPEMIEEMKKTTWKPQPLPFEIFMPTKDVPDVEATSAKPYSKAVNQRKKEGENDSPPQIHELDMEENLEQEKNSLNVRIAYTKVTAVGEETDAAHDIYVFHLAELSQLDEKRMLRIKEIPDLNGRILALEGVKLTLKFDSFVDSKRIPKQGMLESTTSPIIYHEQHEVVETLSVHDKNNQGTPFSLLLGRILENNQADIARVVREQGVTIETIHRWMNGESEPRPMHLKKLLEVLSEYRNELIDAIDQTFPKVLNAFSSPVPNMSPVEVFISYADEDKVLCQQLEGHLKSLEAQGFLKIEYGSQTKLDRLEDYSIIMHNSFIFLLLISPDYLISKKHEIVEAMMRNKRRTAIVIPIILRPCYWTDMPFSRLQVLPKDARPVTLWDNRDVAFMDIVQGIRQAIQDLQNRQ